MFTAHLFKSAWSNRTPRGSIISQGKVTCSSSTLRSQIVSTWVVNKSNKEEKISKLWPLQALYSKLFLVLGLTWTFEPLNELLRSQGLCAQVCSNIGVAVNAVNLLRGVAMFVIFVCKRSCLEKVSRFLQSKQTATPAGSMELQVNPDKWKRNIRYTMTWHFRKVIPQWRNDDVWVCQSTDYFQGKLGPVKKNLWRAQRSESNKDLVTGVKDLTSSGESWCSSKTKKFKLCWARMFCGKRKQATQIQPFLQFVCNSLHIIV